ncbi:MAG: MarR family winged helix-turn-helix transcriptional regulator [Bacteriovoracia bacterium]
MIKAKYPRKDLELLLKKTEVESWRALMGAFQAVFRKLERALLKNHKCTVSRFQILFFLYFEGPMAATEVAKRLCVTRGNISMFLKRMHADDLIEASPSSRSQKRSVFSLTPKGRDFFEGLFPSHIKRVCTFMPGLDPKTIVLLRQISSQEFNQKD